MTYKIEQYGRAVQEAAEIMEFIVSAENISYDVVDSDRYLRDSAKFANRWRKKFKGFYEDIDIDDQQTK